MGLPLVDRFDHQNGWLLQGRHLATLDEVAELFIDQAPHPEPRRRLFEGLVAWIDSLHAVVSSDRIWVDGGFLTHKQDPPQDVDVVAFVKPSLLTKDVNYRLSPLLTRVEDQVRIQPMGGRVDGFVVPGSVEQKVLWVGEWSRVRHPVTRDEWDGKTKGFVEVTW